MKVTIDRFENDKAILKFKTGEIFIYPIKYLEEGLEEGDVVNLLISKDNLETNNKQNTAKDILNEILSE